MTREQQTKDVATDAQAPSVAIIVLNWNGWPDTLECLESLMRLEYPSFEVVVCDNASTDGSATRIQQWMDNALCVLPTSSEMAQFSVPAMTKSAFHLEDESTEASLQKGRVRLIQNPSNLGFAAGNNTGLRDALARGFEYFWVLNADTVVEPDALDRLVARLRAEEGAGICGSLLCYYAAPDVIQEAGGCQSYPLLGVSRRLAGDKKRSAAHPWTKFEKQLGYVSGASCLVSRAFLEKIGLMSEDYFLYCEEIDWATRGRGRFSLALAHDSIVYHKKGISTGSKAVGQARSAASSFYLWRARRRFTQRYYPLGLISLCALGAATSLSHRLKGEHANAKATLAGLMDRAWSDPDKT